jgi:hypothetical protein
MPQPLSRVRSKSPSLTVFGPQALSAAPNLVALPMQVIAIWAAIESMQAQMLARMLKAEVRTGIAMFQALASAEARKAALNAAAQVSLSAEDARLLQAVSKVTKASRDRRNEYAHHIWGVLGQPVEALLLVDPKDYLRDRVQSIEYQRAMTDWSEKVRAASGRQEEWPPQPTEAPATQLDKSRVMVFRLPDLTKDVKDALRAHSLFHSTSFVLGENPHSSAAARQDLLADNDIAKAL